MGQRAKMSDREAEAARMIAAAMGCLPRDRRHAAYAALAECEARAILAETEPEIPGFNACNPANATGTGYTLWAAYESALAESLAAFVGQE